MLSIAVTTLVLSLFLDSKNFFALASVCSGNNYEVPDFLSSTHINVAAASNGATCTASSNTVPCTRAIDGHTGSPSTNHEWEQVGGVGHFIKVTFARTFTVNTLKIMQRANTIEQYKKIVLTFSGGETYKTTLKRNTGTSSTDLAMWDVRHFPEVRANWIKITVESVYSTAHNGFKEIEIYNRNANKGKLCDTLVLPVGIKSELQPLFGRTVSLLLKSSGAKVTLHSKDESSANKYTFGIEVNGKCTLDRFVGSNTQVHTTSCSAVVNGGGWRSVWIDFRNANIVLGSGTTVIFQYLDSAPFEVGYVSFEATTATSVILCNRENKCYQDADHHWPLDKVSGGEFHDLNGGVNGITNITNSDHLPTFNAYNMRALAPMFNTSATPPKYAIFGDFRGDCVGDVESCVNGMTLSFRVLIPNALTTAARLIGTRGASGLGLSVDFNLNQIRCMLYLRLVDLRIDIPIVTERQYHFAMVWTKKKALKVYANGLEFAKVVRTEHALITNISTVLKIGELNSNKGAFQISDVAVWKRELSSEEINQKLACSHVGIVDDSCSPAVKGFSINSSYTVDQCASIGGCHDGSTCYRRDGGGTQATISTAGSTYTASSEGSRDTPAINGKITSQDATLVTSGWSPSLLDKNPYLQIDTGQTRDIHSVVVQGTGKSSETNYVTTFSILKSKSCKYFQPILEGSSKKIFNGNVDSTAMVTVAMPAGLEARCLRIEPIGFAGKIALKAKILGTRKAKSFTGCYKSGDFTAAEYYDSVSLTPERCITACGIASKTYAALKYGKYCFCGTAVNSANIIADSFCSTPCSGNVALDCGSDEAYSVYSISGSFPTSFQCSLPENVTSMSTFSATCTKRSLVECDFGESPSVIAEDKALNHSYISVPSDFNVHCKGYLDVPGESAEMLYDTKIKVYDDFEVALACPSFAPTREQIYCEVQVTKGTGLQISYQLLGQPLVTMELCDAIGMALGEVFTTPVGGSSEPSNTTEVLLDTRAPDYGRFLGIEANVEREGCVSIQKLRPICGSGTSNLYKYVDGKTQRQSVTCSFTTNCTANQAFSTDSRQCVVNGTFSDNVVTAPQERYEVVAVNHVCFTSVGRIRILFDKGNQSNITIGEVFALHFPASGSAKLSRRDSSESSLGGRPTVVNYNSANNGIGSILELTGSAVSHVEYSILFIVKMKCVFRLPLNYTAVGVFSEKISIKHKTRTQEYSAVISAQDKIENVVYSFRRGAIVNEPYTFSVDPHSGTNITYLMRFDVATYVSTFRITAPTPTLLNFTYTTKGTRSISIKVSNGVSQKNMACQLKVMDKVEGLSLTKPVPPQTYPTVTAICFMVTKGNEVTITADFGNGLSAANGTFDISDIFIGCFNHSYEVGTYRMTVNATNLASEQEISQLIIVEKEILELSFKVMHSARDIEVNESICVVVNVTQGTTPTYRIDWGDGQIVEGRQIEFCRSFGIYDTYTINVTAFNNVSSQNTSQQIQVHKPVFPLTNFNVTCPPTNFSNPTPCVLTITGGNDFICNWTFGDGTLKVSNSSHVGKPFNHTYAAFGYYDVQLSCDNRLYNTTVQTLAIVEKPILGLNIGQIPNCPHGQSTTVYVSILTGTGVEFTLQKSNVHTGFSVELVPSFNPQLTNGSVTFTCTAIGVYCMSATAVNNVTMLQSYTMCFKIDYTIVGASAARLTPEYITVEDTSRVQIKMTQGSNVTCYWDFKDGDTELPHFLLGVYPSGGKIVSHAYRIEGDFYVSTVCNNSVSEVTFITPIKSQHPAKDVLVVCSEPQPFPPGLISCTIKKPDGVPTPTNFTCITDFGDKHQKTKLLVSPLKLTHSYAKVGAYDITVICSNQVSNTTLTSSVEVQTPIDNDVMILTTSGGLFGSGGRGRGKDFSNFPTKHNISLDLDWGNGTNVSVSIDWGDNTKALITNKSIIHMYPNEGTYSVVIKMFNAVNSKIKTYNLNLQEAVEGFSFDNNGPVAYGKTFIFLVAVEQVGTDTCFSLGVGNGTTYLYKPKGNAICENECSHGTVVLTYKKHEFPFNVTHKHHYIGNYIVNAVACNKVSRMTFNNLANLSPKPCKYPVVNFTSREANFTMDKAVPYQKSLRITLTPLIKIDCEATKLSTRGWKILKCDEESGNCTDYSPGCLKSMATENPSLVIPARCLEYGPYKIKLKVEMIGGGTSGIFTDSAGYIKITKSPLIAGVHGGTSKSVGYGKVIPVDGTLSTDPDTGDNVGITYYWLCAEKSESFTILSNSSDLPGKPTTLHSDLDAALNNKGNPPSHLYKGCYGHGPGRLDVVGSKVMVNTTGMKINYTYEVSLLTVKDTRWATTTLSLDVVAGNPPDCTIVCVAGCGVKINPSDKHALKVECKCPECGALSYTWGINMKSKTTNEMTSLNNVKDMISTSINFINLVVKPNMLQGDSEYEFRINAYDSVHKVAGHAARSAVTNSAPSQGNCKVDPKEGDNETPFNFSCKGWNDDDAFITFSFNVFDNTTNILTSLGSMKSKENNLADMVSFVIKVPTGKEEKRFLQIIRFLVCDPLLSCTVLDFEITVKLKDQSEGEFQAFLSEVLNPEGTINVLLGEGKLDDLCTYSLTTVTALISLQATPALSVLSKESKDLVQKTVEYLMNSTCEIVSSDSKKASCKATVISSLLKVNTVITDAVKQLSSDGLLEAASDISNYQPSELASSATGLLSAFGTSVESSSQTASSSSTTTDAPPTMAYDEFGDPIEPPPPPTKSPAEIKRERQAQKEKSKKVESVLNNMGQQFLNQMVPGEDVSIQSSLLNMSVTKKSASELQEFSSPSGTSIGGLNNAVAPNSTEDISVKLLAFNSNPNSWAEGASDVSGASISFNLGSDNGSEKVIKDVEPIELKIRQTGQKINMSYHEISPKACKYHVLTIPKNHSSIFVETIPADVNVPLFLYLKRGDRPTKSDHDFNFTLFHNETNPNATKPEKSPFMWFISNDELNKTSAGKWKLAVCEEEHYVPPTIGDVTPQLSYNISLFTAACMFLNETTGKFSDAGLKVGAATTRDVTQCFTTHATSFAGDFFVPPNSIDWSKISLDELMKNPVVFIVVMVIFGLYFIVLIWARRADKKDLDKIGLTPLPDNDPRDNYLYEVVVYTGHASGSGTTSEVFMILTGGLDETSPRQLKDPEPSRVKFLRGAVDYFLLAVPHSLGKLKQLRIWHNNQGSDPSWFLQRIMVRDLQTDTKTWFVNLRWLAVEEDDGRIDRTLQIATKAELTNFNLLFSTEARKNLTDNHLWFSIVARPAKSTFTRVQRLSCCLSVILTTMVANAMFYEVGTDSSSGTSIHVGPFSFSIKQISIGIQSSLVVLPVNVLIVTIFRKIRPADPKKKEDVEKDINHKGDKYKPEDDEQTESSAEQSESDEEQDEKENKDQKGKQEKKKKKYLSPKFAYLAYVLVFLASTVSGTFTIFYGLTFGKEKSEGWISSIMISFWQDVLISQPLKVFAAAMFFALVIKDPNKGEEEDEPQSNELTQDEELIHKNVKNSEDEVALRKIGFVDKPPDPEKLEAARQLKLKEKQMKSIIYEMVQYLFFLVIVLIIAYGNRDPMAYGVTRAMESFFVDSDYTGTSAFDGSNYPAKYWLWVDQTYLATLKPQFWYGPVVRFNTSEVETEEVQKKRKIIKLKNNKGKAKWKSVNGNYIKNPSVVFQYRENFVADHETAYLVGSPRLRQLRVKKDQCTMLPFAREMFKECNADYEWDNEDKNSYHPFWRPFGQNDTENPKSRSAWYYRSAWELKGTPYWGHFASYWGGGYVADFGSDRTVAERIAATLSSQGWIDKYTRAIFAEFTVYNAYTNFFSAVTLLTEVRATGGYHHMPKVQTLRLYRYIGPEMVFVMACEITYIAFLLYFLYKQVKKYREEGKEYFSDSWNYLEIAVLSFSIASVGLYFARLGMTKYTISNMKETPNYFVSFQYVAFLDEWVSACCSLAVFFSFLKFLRLLRFNRRMALLSQTLKQAATPLFFFFVYFGFIFLAYAQFGFAVFGVHDDNYSSFGRTIATLFGMTLGDFDFPALVQANRVFGPVYFFSYVLLILFILMNVFLSIIVDTFNEVNRDVLKQGNDHEILSFMIHSVKANIGKQVGPAIKPTYVEEKSKLEKDVDNIEEISDNIEYAFRNICMEDIRQVKWFDPKAVTRKKKLIMAMILEADENYSENDICDAIPVFDDYMANHTEEEIIQAALVYREKRRQEELADFISRMTDSSDEAEETESDSETDDEDTIEQNEQTLPTSQFLSPYTNYEEHPTRLPVVTASGTQRSRKSHHGGKRSRRGSRAGLIRTNVDIGPRSPSSTDLHDSNT